MSARPAVGPRPEARARRQALAALEPVPDTHAGLWLERYLPQFGVAGGNQAHLEAVLPLSAGGPAYARHFERWRATLESLPGTLLARATVRGRMVVGLGSESVLETAVSLHRTYGVPFIPGSALKGLAAAAAHRRLADTQAWRRATAGQPAGDSHRILFGDTDDSGAVVFHDALWWPERQAPLDLDVMTVHHPRYYRGEKEQGQPVPPADWDSPNPVAFVTARGDYLVAVTGPGDWAGAALAIIGGALAEDGVGAKTAAGYGRLDVVPLGPAGGAGRQAGGQGEAREPGSRGEPSRSVPAAGGAAEAGESDAGR